MNNEVSASGIPQVTEMTLFHYFVENVHFHTFFIQV